IRLNRNETNMGFGASINRAMRMATGEFIVIASADDVSLPNRVEVLQRCHAESGGKAISVFSNATVIDENGKQHGRHYTSFDKESLTLSFMARRFSGVLGATHGWHRRVFDVFGPITENKVVAEDQIISFRSALLGEVRFVDELLVLYRLHDNNAQFKLP